MTRRVNLNCAGKNMYHSKTSSVACDEIIPRCRLATSCRMEREISLFIMYHEKSAEAWRKAMLGRAKLLRRITEEGLRPVYEQGKRTC